MKPVPRSSRSTRHEVWKPVLKAKREGTIKTYLQQRGIMESWPRIRDGMMAQQMHVSSLARKDRITRAEADAVNVFIHSFCLTRAKKGEVRTPTWEELVKVFPYLGGDRNRPENTLH